MEQKIAIIIGAGPAGLTAAYELLEKTAIKPVIFELSSDIGGLSKTVRYKGNRMDIGPHRFFSKSERVMNWWQKMLPLQGKPARDDIILKRKLALSTEENAPDPETSDRVMLFRNRLSRIFFLGSFFDYPIRLKWSTLKNLGVQKILRIGASYINSKLIPIKFEKSLEDFFINRFGKELYQIFFKDYTEKVWGVPCSRIKPEWGRQRIKGLSIGKAIGHSLSSSFHKDSSFDQKKTETSFIEHFLYPKLGAGQMWEEVARQIVAKGGEIYTESEVIEIIRSGKQVTGVGVRNNITDLKTKYDCDYVFSSMPVKNLVQSMIPEAPSSVQEVANGLMYRDFIIIGMLLKRLKRTDETKTPTINRLLPDNWIYIQEKAVKLGRVTIFNNWSPYLVKDPDTVWLGLEYFCNEGDELWNKPDAEFIAFAIDEIALIEIIDKEDVLDATVVRMKKAYPAYFGAYEDFQVIRDFTDEIENLFLVGRNGMHRYNNTDHSMLTAMLAVENIIKGIPSKDNIWQVNAEDDYHEQV